MQFYVYSAVRVKFMVLWNKTPCKSVRQEMEAVGSTGTFVSTRVGTLISGNYLFTTDTK